MRHLVRRLIAWAGRLWGRCPACGRLDTPGCPACDRRWWRGQW